jgi:hypothetical protein
MLNRSIINGNSQQAARQAESTTVTNNWVANKVQNRTSLARFHVAVTAPDPVLVCSVRNETVKTANRTKRTAE